MVTISEEDLYDLVLDVEECYYFETNEVSKKVLRSVLDRLWTWWHDIAADEVEDDFDHELAQDMILERQEMLDFAEDDDYIMAWDDNFDVY